MVALAISPSFNQSCNSRHGMDLQVNIQCYQEVCCDTKKSSILQQFLNGTKSIDRASKSVCEANEINVGRNYKPGGTGIVAFGKEA